jgi:pilus assembly protein Flp/PilA
VRDTYRVVLQLRIWADARGQDLIEYALVAGFLAVTAAALSPNIASSVSTICSRITSVLPASTGVGG